jgi:hypothetical protein
MLFTFVPFYGNLHKYVEEVLPSTERVIDAIAKINKIRIIPTGTYVLQTLG